VSDFVKTVYNARILKKGKRKMKRAFGVVWFPIIFVFATIVFAGQFKVYPGAKLDEQATREIRQTEEKMKAPHKISAIYTTDDSFEKARNFYKGIAKESTIPGIAGNQAFFIFDGADDIMSSKLWIKIQRPFATAMKPQKVDIEFLKKMKPGSTMQVQTEGLRDITAILVYEGK
jgi:hypothetical protein